MKKIFAIVLIVAGLASCSEDSTTNPGTGSDIDTTQGAVTMPTDISGVWEAEIIKYDTLQSKGSVMPPKKFDFTLTVNDGKTLDYTWPCPNCPMGITETGFYAANLVANGRSFLASESNQSSNYTDEHSLQGQFYNKNAWKGQMKIFYNSTFPGSVGVQSYTLDILAKRKN